MKTFKQFLRESKQLKEDNKLDLLTFEDFEIYKNEDGLYQVKSINDNSKNFSLYISPSESYTKIKNKLETKIFEYNKKNMSSIKKAITLKLHKLFKNEGLIPFKSSTTSVRGFHSIEKNGYYFNTKTDPFGFDIIVTFNNNNKMEEYLKKIKIILNKENIKYKEYPSGDIMIDLLDQ